jgi:hypothetical protein
MPSNKKLSKPLPEELTKDLYRVNKLILLPAPQHLLKKYNVRPDQVLIPFQRRYQMREAKDTLFYRWELLAKSFGNFI